MTKRITAALFAVILILSIAILPAYAESTYNYKLDDAANVLNPNEKSQLLSTIKEVSDSLVAADWVGAVLNRVLLPERITETEIGGVPLVAVIPPDPAHAENDIEGKSVFDLPDDSVILNGAREILQKMGLL